MPYTSDSWTFGHVPTTFKRLPTVNRWGVLHGFYSDQRDDQELSNSAPDMPSGVGFRILANRNIWRFPNITGNLKGLRRLDLIRESDTRSNALRWEYNETDQNLHDLAETKQAGTIQINFDPSLDASRQNPIYGCSNSVRVDSIYGLYLIRAYQS